MVGVKGKSVAWLCLVEDDLYLRLEGPVKGDTPAWWVINKETRIPSWSSCNDARNIELEQMFPDMLEKPNGI